MSTELVTLGEAMVGLVASEPGPLASARSFEPFVAGAEANVAVGVSRLGHTAAFIGRIGADGFGTAIARTLRGEGVDVTGLDVDPDARTGIFVRERRLVGPADLVYHRAGSAGSRLDRADVDGAAAVFEGASWLHVTGITPALSASAREAVGAAMQRARAGGATIGLDINLRRKLWADADARPVLRDLATASDIVFASLEEVAVVLGEEVRSANDAATGILDLGPEVAVIKLGPAGALARERDMPGASHEGFPVPLVVDPVGAGDAFVAGFVAARLEARDLATALAWGNAAGASVAASVGDMTGLPTRAELDAIIAAGPDTIR
jgi:2-dehydro-3-deoxygluconokinase